MERETVPDRITMGQVWRWKSQTAMRKKLLAVLFCFSVLSIIILQAGEKKKNNRIKIVCSVFPLQEFANAVAGERGEASLLLPPGAEIHTWKPRTSDIIKLSSADLFIYVGASLEPWLNDILASTANSNLRILEASRGLSLMRERRDEHEAKNNFVDPHIWLDFENDQIVVDRIQEFLSEIDPEGESIFKKNATVYKNKLQELDQDYRESLRNCLKRTFILGGHAAFAYLAERYGLNQISLYGLSPDSMPTPKHLVEVVELAKEHQIKVIYFESHISDELAKVMAKEVGAKTLVLNSGANITKEQMKSGVTFLEIMKKNLENLKDGLVCNRGKNFSFSKKYLF